MLAKRLAGHGLAVSGGALAAMLSQNVGSASVPASVMSSTIRAASLYGAGQAAGAISAQVASLTEGVIRAMLLSKLKVATTCLLAAGIVTAAVSLGILPVLAVAPPEPLKMPRPAPPEGGEPPAAATPVVVNDDAAFAVVKLAWSADGKVVASASVASGEPMVLTDHEGKNPKTFPSSITTIKLWDASTGKLKQVLGAEKKAGISQIAFSPDKKTAAIVVSRPPERRFYEWVEKAGDPPPDRGKTELRVVDAQTWAVKQTIPVDLFDVGTLQAFAFSPDGKTLAFGGASSRVVGGAYVKLWDLQNGKMKGGTKLAAPTRMSLGDGGVCPLQL
jgi:WD40-like Beta Propeller Repeat